MTCPVTIGVQRWYRLHYTVVNRGEVKSTTNKRARVKRLMRVKVKVCQERNGWRLALRRHAYADSSGPAQTGESEGRGYYIYQCLLFAIRIEIRYKF